MAEIIPSLEEQNTKEVIPFKWGSSIYYTLDKNLEIIHESNNPPKEWGIAKSIFPRRKRKVIVDEEVYVTLLSLFLRKFAEDDLSFINRSYWSTWGGVDLTAVDELWRIHLFELKNGNCRIDDLNQLERYFRATSFENLEKYINANLNNSQFSENIMKTLMFGLYTGSTTALKQKTSIEKELNRHIKKKEWDDHKLKTEFITEFIKKDIHKIWDISISEEEIRNNYIKWFKYLEDIRNKLRNRVKEEISLKWLLPEHKCVLWLVGNDFDKKVNEKIIQLRGERMDVRLLIMEVRFSKGINFIFIKIQKEDYPERENVARDLSTWIKENKGFYNI